MSMTGYGRDVFQFNDATILIEIKSVNHRFLDYMPHFPRNLMFLEEPVRKVIQTYFKRGRIAVFIEVHGSAFNKKTLELDWDFLDDYVQKIKDIKKTYQLEDPISLSLLATNPDCMWIEKTEEQPLELQEYILEAVKQTCLKVKRMREVEGEFLQADIEKHMECIHHLINRLEKQRPIVIQEYQRRIHYRLEDYVGNLSFIEQERYRQEIALLAEKGDIVEEIVRLNSHIHHFKQTLNEAEAIGRKLDFILQEMQREANTIGAKSTDPEISELAVQLKSVIEKVKEQVQNIE
ncbi:YicC/YloC family endoribonuclease [Cerasibacillus quisquiliarum]|nr:YicC/YloC family endoribonuclease [Cerasibacillus quisquiliarum]